MSTGNLRLFMSKISIERFDIEDCLNEILRLAYADYRLKKPVSGHASSCKVG